MITVDIKSEQKEKVCCIEDIDKIYSLYLKRHLTVKEFDTLYELPVNKLQRAVCNIKDSLERERTIKNLTDAIDY